MNGVIFISLLSSSANRVPTANWVPLMLELGLTSAIRREARGRESHWLERGTLYWRADMPFQEWDVLCMYQEIITN